MTLKETFPWTSPTPAKTEVLPPPPDLLERAADLIDTQGWRRYRMGKKTPVGPHCALGAIIAANGGVEDENYHRAVTRLSLAIGGNSNKPEKSVWRWNDRFVRSGAIVSHFMRVASKN